MSRKYTEIEMLSVHRHPLLPQLNAGVVDCRAHTLLRLLHRRIGKPHQFKARRSQRHIHLNVDNSSVNPECRRTIGLCKRQSSLLRFKYKKIITQDRGCCLIILCKRKEIPDARWGEWNLFCVRNVPYDRN